jgi:UDP-N-acetylglucosamine:LPS N-acetylglucosamine transferase
MIQQTVLTPELLGATVRRLIHDESILSEMREKTLLRARPDAAQTIAAKILSMSCFK